MRTIVAARFAAPAASSAALPVVARLAALPVVARLAALPVVARLAALFLSSALIGTPLAAQQAAPQRGAETAATSVTLYQDGRVLVRRALPMRIPAGASTQRIPLGAVDPSSFFALDSDVSLTGAITIPGADADGVLRSMVGKLLTFRSGIALRDTVSATLIGVDPVRVRLADGTIFFGLPGQPTFPSDKIPSEAMTDVRVQARKAADQLRIGGFAQGGGWNAMYAVVLRGSVGQVSGLASFTAPFIADDAEVQLLAGQVNQAATPTPMYRQRAPMAAARVAEADMGTASQQKVGEFHLYTLPGRHQLNPGTLTSVALFDPATAPVSKSYEVASPIPFYGYWGQTGDQGDTPVSVYYTLARARRTTFGDAPLPGGAVRIFQPDSAGRLQLIGEAGIDHTAPGEELRINAGNAFDLVAKRIQTDWQQGTEPIPGVLRRTRTFVTSAYADTLRNQGDAEALIDVLVERGGDWRIVESSQPADRVSSTKARFRVKVPAQAQAVVTYRIRATW